MADYYADSSALVKRHIPEIGSAWFQALADQVVGNTITTARVSMAKDMRRLLRCIVVGGPPTQCTFGSFDFSGAGADMLSLTVDGVAVKNLQAYRATAGPFDVTLPGPDDNLEHLFSYDIAGPTVGPVVSDGYWVILAPLSAGDHIIHFTGRFPIFGPQGQDITYHLTVLP